MLPVLQIQWDLHNAHRVLVSDVQTATSHNFLFNLICFVETTKLPLLVIHSGLWRSHNRQDLLSVLLCYVDTFGIKGLGFRYHLHELVQLSQS